LFGQVDIATKRKLKLDSADIEQELALDSDSDDFYERSDSGDELIEQQHEQEPQPGASAGGDSNWGTSARKEQGCEQE
jgi:hypothetical protein